jgi:hypothetical protein
MVYALKRFYRSDKNQLKLLQIIAKQPILLTKSLLMKKIYSLLFIVLPFSALHSQCPVINAAFVNACGTNEGLNEFIVFTTTAQVAVNNYTFYYGSVTPPTGSPTAVLAGSNARTLNGTGNIISTGGCSIIYVTSASTVIPFGAKVVFIPSNFENTFNISLLCTSGTIYVVPIDITAAPSNWNTNGSFDNNPGAATNRYLQIATPLDACTNFIRTYVSGWTSDVDGNFVAWDPLSGMPTYSNVGCDLVTLPVTLVSFTAVAQGKNASISWQSVSEINTKSFELQRSPDGSKFSAIYSIQSGHNGMGNDYSFIDAGIPQGSLYYRLKITDADGTVAYSKVAKVISTRNGFVITNVFPKPAGSQLSISWNAPRAGNTTASVYDFSGRKLVTQLMTTNTGMNYFRLQVGSLPKGAYLLKLEKDGETVVTEFTKQ